MKICAHITLLAALLPAASLVASGLGVGGPISGFYTDPRTGAVYPISGVPGSATLGQALSLGFQFVSIAPDGHTALALQNGTLVLLADITQPTNLTPLSAWSDPIAQAVWASDASGVVVYSLARSSLRTITGIPANPVLNPEVRVSGEMSGLRLSRAPWSIAFDAIRVERQGHGVAGARIKSLYLSINSNTPLKVDGVVTPGPMDFSADGNTLYVIDQADGGLLAIGVRNTPSTAPVRVAFPAGATAGVVALSVSSDGLYLYAAEAPTKNVCAVELATGNSLFCAAPDVAPVELQQLGPSLYLLNTPTDSTTPLWLLDAGQRNVFFVPRGGQTRG